MFYYLCFVQNVLYLSIDNNVSARCEITLCPTIHLCRGNGGSKWTSVSIYVIYCLFVVSVHPLIRPTYRLHLDSPLDSTETCPWLETSVWFVTGNEYPCSLFEISSGIAYMHILDHILSEVALYWIKSQYSGIEQWTARSAGSFVMYLSGTDP